MELESGDGVASTTIIPIPSDGGGGDSSEKTKRTKAEASEKRLTDCLRRQASGLELFTFR